MKRKTDMKHYIIDTQALVKFLNGKKVINNTIDTILQETEKGNNIVIIPSVKGQNLYFTQRHKRYFESCSKLCRRTTFNRYN